MHIEIILKSDDGQEWDNLSVQLTEKGALGFELLHHLHREGTRLEVGRGQGREVVQPTRAHTAMLAFDLGLATWLNEYGKQAARDGRQRASRSIAIL